MKSKALRARVVSAVIAVAESLERRWLLSVSQPQPVSEATITPGAVVVPWKQLNPAGTDTGKEQLNSVVETNGITAILTSVQNFCNTDLANGSVQFGNTSMELFTKLDTSSTWHEIDINTAFDGRPDTRVVQGQTENFARKDDQMAANAAGDVLIEFSGDASGLAVDRIPAQMLQDLANNTPITPYSSTQILDLMNVAAIGVGNYQPQLAVGPDPSAPTDPARYSVYVFQGIATVPNVYSWHGGTGDPLWRYDLTGNSNTIWNDVADPNKVGGSWSPLAVGADGNLYGTENNGKQVYQMSLLSPTPAFTPVFAPLSGVVTQLAAYAPPIGSGASPLLYALTTDSTLRNTVASTPTSGGSGAWTYALTPIDALNAASVSGPLLAVDPVTAQASVLYENYSSKTLNVAVETASRTWSIKQVSAPITFAVPNQTGSYGNDATKPEWYSVYGDKAAVTWMQQDQALPAGSGDNDVADVPVDLAPVSGYALTVTNDVGTAISLSGSAAASGTLVVGVDGQSYPFSLGAPIVQVTVVGEAGAALTVDETGAAGAPIPLVTFAPDAGQPPVTLNVVGITSAFVNTLAVVQPGSVIGIAGVSALQLHMDDNNDTVQFADALPAVTTVFGGAGNGVISATLDVAQPEPGALTVIGGTGMNQLILWNTGTSAPTVVFASDVVTAQNLTINYDATLTSIELEGPNTLPDLDFSAGVPLPVGSSAVPGLIDQNVTVDQITDVPGGDAIVYGSSYQFIGGHYLHLQSVNTLNLGDGVVTAAINGGIAPPQTINDGPGDDTITVNASSLTANLTVNGGAGNDTVIQNGQNGDSVNQAHLIFNGGAGDDTLTFTFAQASGNGLPQTVFNGGGAANVLNYVAKRGVYGFTTTIDPSWTRRLTVNVSATGASPEEEEAFEAEQPAAPSSATVEFDSGFALAAVNVGLNGHMVFTTAAGAANSSTGTLSVTDASGTATVDGAASLEIQHASTILGMFTVINGGAAQFDESGALGMPRTDQTVPLPIVLPAADVPVSTIHSLNIASGSVKLVTAAPSIFYVDSLLPMGPASQFDIGNNAVLLQRGALPNDDPNSVVQQVYQDVVNAYNSPNPGIALGDWNGFGITSALAKADIALGAARLGYAIGVWDSTDAQIQTGQAAGTVLIAPTYLGDASGNGSTGNEDYAIWHNQFGNGDDWSQGDWNYDQFTDNADFAIWRNFFGAGS